MATGIALGIGIGSIFGIAVLENAPLGIAMGIALGAALGYIWR